MDILSYSLAKKSKKRLEKTKSDIGSGAKGNHDTIKERVDEIESTFREVWAINDKVRLQTYLSRLALAKKKEALNLGKIEDLDYLIFHEMDTAKSINLVLSSGYKHEPDFKRFDIYPGGKLTIKDVKFKYFPERFYFDFSVGDTEDEEEFIIFKLHIIQNGKVVQTRSIENRSMIRFDRERRPHAIRITAEHIPLSTPEEIREPIPMKEWYAMWTEDVPPPKLPAPPEEPEKGGEDDGEDSTEE